MTPIIIAGPFKASVSYDFKEVHNVTVGLLGALDANDVPVGLAAAGAGMVLGKLLSPTAMTTEESSKFLNDLLGWVGMYFIEGGIN